MTQISIVQSKSKTIQATGPVTGAANNGSGAVRLTVVGHGLESGDWVQVAGVGGVPAATGQFQVAVIASSTYDLIGSTFGGSFSSGGTSQHVGYSVVASLGSFDFLPTNSTLVFLLQSAPTGASLRFVFEDAGSSSFVDAMPVAAGSFAGASSASCDRRWNSRYQDTPDWRLAELNDNLRLRLLWPLMTAGQVLTFSSWLEY